MSEDLEECLLYTEFLNVASEAVESIDEDYDDISGFGDDDNETDEYENVEEDYDDPLDELEELEDFDDHHNEADILQCIINMIELEVLLSKNAENKGRKRQRRWGVHPINQMRREHGHFQNLFQEMLVHDHEKFFNYTRMTPERFNHLLELVGPEITKHAPNALPPECRLLITLRYNNFTLM